MKNQKKERKLLKIVLGIIILIIVLIIALTEGIGNYFVNYAIARSGKGGNRNISEDSKIELLGEDEKIIEENRKKENELAMSWSENVVKNKVEVETQDGITLRGTQYMQNEENNNWSCSNE